VEPLESSFPIVFNKVTSPRYVTPTLRRARLLDWLNERATCRAIVLAADAGYGKTTLLWQWEREVEFPCYWYKLDRSDRDWSLHITYMIQAIAQRHEGFGRKTTSMLRQMGGPGTSRPGVAAYLVSEMYRYLTEPCTFIIDDWQYVASVTEVRGLWNQIIRDAPPTCRFVFASRAKPQLQFARFKTHGGYAELRTNALRFNDREIEELFRDIYRDPLAPGEVAELERRTEGWAASLQLVEVSLRERKTPEERRQFIESISAEASDSDLFDFLAEEVLDQLSEESRNFLLSTSILMQITPDLAERLTGVHDGARELDDLEQRGLFTYRVDEKRYRYHNLFRDFLEKRLARDRGEAEITGLHIHAASYYETSAEWPQAIHHYLKAGLQRQAARLIARHGEDVVAEGHLGMVDEWLQKLPARTIRENARLSLLHGQALSMRGEYTQALEALNRARTYFARKGDNLMEATACVNLSSLYLHHGESALSVAIATDGFRLVPEKATAVRMRLRGNLALARTWEDGPEASARTCLEIAHEAEALQLHHYAAIAYHNYGVLTRESGNHRGSLEALEKARSIWDDAATSPFADNCELVLSLLALGEVTIAEERAREGMRRTKPWPLPLATAEFGLANALMARGEFDEAMGLLWRVVAEPASEGQLREVVLSALVGALAVSDAKPAEIDRATAALASIPHDVRYTVPVMTALSVGSHFGSAKCGGTCLTGFRITDEAASAWPVASATHELVQGVLALDHASKTGAAKTVAALKRVYELDAWRPLKWWTRRLTMHFESMAAVPEFPALATGIARADPAAWRAPLARLVALTEGEDRRATLAAVVEISDRSSIELLRGIKGRDVDDVRKRLIRSQAPRLFIRTLGTLTIHKGGWESPPYGVTRTRIRGLLGLLAAHLDTGVSRDSIMDALWPDSDPAAAINNLNQSVYKLRRFLDPGYAEGESPTYLIADSESVRLDPELVRTDVSELRRLSTKLHSGARSAGDGADAASAIVQLAKGEFLPELRYEDWASSKQLAVMEEIRRALLPIAEGRYAAQNPLLAAHAAAVLVSMDPYDETANIALATQLAVTGRRVAARTHLERFLVSLTRDLGDEPGEELRALAHRLGASIQ